MTGNRILEIRDLTTSFPVNGGEVRAVDHVSFNIEVGEILCLVGESGCGKSMTALSIMRLVPPPGSIISGRILFKGEDLLGLEDEAMRKVRGDGISMVFQEPMSALNPVFTIGDQVGEVLRVHREVGKNEARRMSTDLLRKVGIPDPEQRIMEYPHQMSGGMQQRVLIAMAIACEPEILIADEPTTALDVTVQAQILDLLTELIREGPRGALLITHDLGVVAETADRVCVMYAGQIIETAPVRDLFEDPLHPYTMGLLESLPHPARRTFKPIMGSVPDLAALPEACRFHPRCPRAERICREVEPGITARGAASVRCHFPGRENGGSRVHPGGVGR